MIDWILYAFLLVFFALLAVKGIKRHFTYIPKRTEKEWQEFKESMRNKKN